MTERRAAGGSHPGRVRVRQLVAKRSGTSPPARPRDGSPAKTWMATNKIFAFPSPLHSDGDGDGLQAVVRSERRRRLSILRNRWDRAVSTLLTRSSNNDEEAGTAIPKGDGNGAAAWSAALSATWFDRLVISHLEPSRAYHTVVHLEEMFGYADLYLSDSTDSVVDSEEDEAIVTLATFFHDAVYDARSASNEEESAKLFGSFASEVRRGEARRGVAAETTDAQVARRHGRIEGRVADCILATQSHSVTVSAEEESDATLLAFFLDADMAVLGKDPRAYDSYCGLIRREYEFVDRDVYCTRRAEILEGFLAKGDVYGTGIMSRALEERARDNLRREVRMLRGGIIPYEFPNGKGGET